MNLGSWPQTVQLKNAQHLKASLCDTNYCVYPYVLIILFENETDINIVLVNRD